MQTKTSDYTVFVDPDPYADNRAADWTYTVQAFGATSGQGWVTVEMERAEAIKLYRATVVARNPVAYLAAIVRRQWAAEREAGYPDDPRRKESDTAQY